MVLREGLLDPFVGGHIIGTRSHIISSRIRHHHGGGGGYGIVVVVVRTAVVVEENVMKGNVRRGGCGKRRGYVGSVASISSIQLRKTSLKSSHFLQMLGLSLGLKKHGLLLRRG